MPAKLRSDDGRHVVIRPLAYVSEDDLIAYAEVKAFPIIPCKLCGAQENLQRQVVRRCSPSGKSAIPAASSRSCARSPT